MSLILSTSFQLPFRDSVRKLRDALRDMVHLSTPFSGFEGDSLGEEKEAVTLSLFQLPFRDSLSYSLGRSASSLLNFQLPFRDSAAACSCRLCTLSPLFQLPFRDSRAPKGAGCEAGTTFNSLFGIH